GNAIKFTQAGHVLVKVSRRDHQGLGPGEACLHFAVEDTGPGIERSAQGRLFRLFSQVDSSASRSFEGTGPGLVISKRLVELMGGTIGVDSEAGRGATFWFTIRCRVVEAASPDSRFKTRIPLRLLVIEPNAMYRGLLLDYVRRFGADASSAGS